MYSCSQALSYRPSSSPNFPKLTVPARRISFSPLTRSFRSSDCQSRALIKKWKICCFKRDGITPENLKKEVLEEILDEELVIPNFGNAKVVRRNWASNVAEAVGSAFRSIATLWKVPWTGETILQVMLFWIASFWFVGFWAVPFAAHMAGFNKNSLTYRGQALYSLLTDATGGLAGIAILYCCLSRFLPLPTGWFNLSFKGNWHIDVALGCFVFPLVNRLSQFNLDLFHSVPSSPAILSSVEQSILARDPVAMGLYALVVSVCAPVWEEILFRGFLLPSLTRYMPVWCSILVSSVVFALAHFNVQRMLPLILLGVVMGVVFSRSRNLLPSMLLHSLWNGFVFLDLMK
ncbi:hypothetical protein V2J09_000432 [Rumex salicifolius]